MDQQSSKTQWSNVPVPILRHEKFDIVVHRRAIGTLAPKELTAGLKVYSMRCTIEAHRTKNTLWHDPYFCGNLANGIVDTRSGAYIRPTFFDDSAMVRFIVPLHSQTHRGVIGVTIDLERTNVRGALRATLPVLDSQFRVAPRSIEIGFLHRHEPIGPMLSMGLDIMESRVREKSLRSSGAIGFECQKCLAVVRLDADCCIYSYHLTGGTLCHTCLAARNREEFATESLLA